MNDENTVSAPEIANSAPEIANIRVRTCKYFDGLRFHLQIKDEFLIRTTRRWFVKFSGLADKEGADQSRSIEAGFYKFCSGAPDDS